VLGVGFTFIAYTIYTHWGINRQEPEQSEAAESPRKEFDVIPNLLEETKSEEITDTLGPSTVIPNKIGYEVLDNPTYVQLMKEIFYR
jgi:hypothetical protein